MYFYCRSFQYIKVPFWICSNYCRGPLATIHNRRSLPLDPGPIAVDAVPFSGDGYTEITPWEGLLISWASEPDHLCFRDTQTGSWYIKELTQVLENDYSSKHLVEILDKVTTAVEKLHFNGQGQRPTYRNGLTERIYFQQ